MVGSCKRSPVSRPGRRPEAGPTCFQMVSRRLTWCLKWRSFDTSARPGSSFAASAGYLMASSRSKYTALQNEREKPARGRQQRLPARAPAPVRLLPRLLGARVPVVHAAAFALRKLGRERPAREHLLVRVHRVVGAKLVHDALHAVFVARLGDAKLRHVLQPGVAAARATALMSHGRRRRRNPPPMRLRTRTTTRAASWPPAAASAARAGSPPAPRRLHAQHPRPFRGSGGGKPPCQLHAPKASATRPRATAAFSRTDQMFSETWWKKRG